MQRIMSKVAHAVLPRATVLRLRVWRALRGSNEPEVRFLPVLAREGAFLDVGANIGSWTGPASRSFQSVHAFEPDAEIVGALRESVAKNVTVHGMALSNRTGVGKFHTPIANGRPVTTLASLEDHEAQGAEFSVCNVRLAPLDTLNLRHIDVVKIDVEGHEAAVLEGAGETIDRERPTLIVEIEDRHNSASSENIIASIVAKGYGCYYVYGNELVPFQAGSIAKLQRRDLLPVAGSRKKNLDYINNFVFIPFERRGERDLIDEFLRRTA